MRIKNTPRTAVLILSFLGLATAMGIVLSAQLYAQTTGTGATAGSSSTSASVSSITSGAGSVSSSVSSASAAPAATCTLTLAGNKSTYTNNETIRFTYACPSPSEVFFQFTKPDGSVRSYGRDYNITNTLSLATGFLVAGNHTLRICVNDQSCSPNSIVSVPFTIVTPAVTCTFTLVENRSTYTTSENIGITATCSGSATIAYQIVNPNGSVQTFGATSNFITNTMRLYTGSLVEGSYIVRLCVNDESCPPNSIAAAVSFTIIASPVVQAASSSSTLRPAAGSASTVTSSSSTRSSISSSAYAGVRTGSSSTVTVPGQSASYYSSSAANSSPSTIAPSSSTTTPVPALPAQNAASQYSPTGAQTQNGPLVYRKLSASKMRLLRSKKKSMLRELLTLERTFKIVKDENSLDYIAELRPDLEAFVPLDTSAYEIMTDFQDEFAELRSRLKH